MSNGSNFGPIPKCVCQKVMDMGRYWNEMNEKISSINMGVDFVTYSVRRHVYCNVILSKSAEMGFRPITIKMQGTQHAA